jgi:GNAT superfamily N-acetyltransferase
MEFGGAPVISLPTQEVEFYRDAVAGWPPGVVRTPGLVQAVFGERVTAIIGLAFVGYTDSRHFRPVSSSEARLLLASDEAAIEMLHAACPVEGWEHGGSGYRPNAMIGVSKGQAGRLAALASCEVWGGEIAHISVIVDPAFRGRGYAATAVSALTKIVLERKLVPQYRTLEANLPSMAVARRLGFDRYATSLAVRLALPDTEAHGVRTDSFQ